MANIASQRKRIARSRREHDENRRRASAVRTHMRRLQDAVDGGDAERIDAEHRALVSRIDKAVRTGAIHRNSGARKKASAERIRSATAS